MRIDMRHSPPVQSLSTTWLPPMMPRPATSSASRARVLSLVAIATSFQPDGACAFIGAPAKSFATKATIMRAATDGRNSDAKSVAVIGGGIAGLACAATLSKSDKYIPTVFDTGRLRPGGRCSSRLPGDQGTKDGASKSQILDSIVIDHAAQILTVPKGQGFEAFEEQVRHWEAGGVLKKFPEGSVCEIADGKGGETFQLKKVNGEMWYGNGGMSAVPQAIASGKNEFRIEQDVWVSPGNGVKFNGEKGRPFWRVQRNGKPLGTFDELVIAHNGKCADRLMSKTPARKLHSLLRTNFAPTVPKWGGKRMTLNSIYSYSFAIKKDGSPLTEKLGEEVISCYVKNHPKLRFLTCQTRKEHDGQTIKNDRFEVWTVLSSPTFAKKYKAPQENIPSDTVEEVSGLLLQAISESLGLSPDSLKKEDILDSKLQLWGAAVPLNTWKTNSTATGETKVSAAESGFLFDSDFGVGACGDWLLDSSIGGAWTSGVRLAEYMMDDKLSSLSAGLPPHGEFSASRRAHQAGIGSIR